MGKFQFFVEIQGKASMFDFLVSYFLLGLPCLKAKLELMLGVALPQCQLNSPAQPQKVNKTLLEAESTISCF